MNCRTIANKKPLSPQVKPLNENVQRYIRCTITRPKQAFNVTEFAEITGVSRKYHTRNAGAIEAYYQTAPQPSSEDMEWFDARSIDYYVQGSTSAKTALGAITGYLMKHRYGLLGHLRKQSKIKSVGNDVVSLITTIKSRKHTTGTPINARSKAARRLLDQNKIAFIDKLFIRTDGYYTGHTARKWKTTELADQILAEAITILFDMITNNKIDFVLNGSAIGCLTKSVTYSSIYSLVTGTSLNTSILPIKEAAARQVPTLKSTPTAQKVQQWYLKPLIIPHNQVQGLCLTSMLHIITQSIGFENGNFIVSLNHTSNTNPMLGRSYNVFTRLRSCERKQLGLINYDISSALQVISLQLIQASESDYPLLTRYSEDIGFKRALREDISTSLNIPMSDVKAKLTAFANGAVSGIDKHPIYKEFQKESDKLRIAVLAYTAEHNPQLLKQSKAQSKKNLPEDIDWFSMNTEDSQSLARAKASVYFFVWTYYERLIRKAMLTVLIDGIEVHDAVYSRMLVSTEILEAVILESTGLQIQIEID